MTKGELYDGKVWVDNGIDLRKSANHHQSGLNIWSFSPSIVTKLTLL